MIYTADFETTTDPNDCRVWAVALCEVGNTNNFWYDNSIDSLMDFCYRHEKNLTLYFHNLKFDGEFIIYWLFHHGYKFVKDRKDLCTKSFTTLISDRNVFYTIKICFLKTDKEEKYVEILDSLKILPMGVEQIAKTFGLKISKLIIDYKEYRPVGHKLSKEEIAYIKNDVTIVAQAIEKLHDLELKKMTTGANALFDYKKGISVKKFNKLFPKPQYDYEVRQSYRGGFTYLNPKFKSVDVGDGIVLDVNSLYPSVMYYEKMPYGEGIRFEGEYKYDKVYDLYIQLFSCQFELKKDKIPTIQLKNDLSFNPIEYLESSEGEYITLCMTNVDLKLFLEQYDVYDITYHSGWKFKSSDQLFRRYIDKWNNVKIQATIDGNKGLRQIAKLMLNSLYGKFALNPNVRSKYPYLGDDDIIHYTNGKEEKRNPIYIPVGTFITSWARNKTIRSAQSVYDRFIYADTDSLHLVGTHLPDNLEISETKLGAWKLENEFTRARFLRQKSYIEEINGELKITCAGMPKGCYQYVNWDNFKIGNQFDGKLRISHTQGGIVLLDSPHTLRE